MTATTARQRGQLVLGELEQARKAYLIEARATADRLVQRRKIKVLTVDEVRLHCPPPDGIDPRVMGAIFNTKDWEVCGFVNSKRGHGRAIRQFRRV